MIEGNIFKELLWFVIPLVLGNIFQQLYNAADSAIVGQFVSKDALAAVSSSGPLINLLISFFMGLSVGAGVVVARYYGAKDSKKMHEAIYSAYIFVIVGGIIMTIVGVLASPVLLKWIGTPEAVMKESVVYLKIYFYGVIGVMVYNMGSGILRSLGDAKTPLYFLIASSLSNVFLDLLFVVVFKMGVAGAAYATLLCQVGSAVLVVILMFKGNEIYHLRIREFAFYPRVFKEIIKVGLPSGIQNAVVSFSNLIVQTNINSFGSIAMAGAGSYTKIDGFAILPVQSISLAITTFVGQNLGAMKYQRIKTGLKTALKMAIVTAFVISLILIFGSSQILRIFSNDEEVIACGALMARIVAPAYILLAISHTAIGYLRAMNRSFVAMIVTLVCWCGVRMLWILSMTRIYDRIEVVFMGWPISWILSALIFIFLLVYNLKGLPDADFKEKA